MKWFSLPHKKVNKSSAKFQPVSYFWLISLILCPITGSLVLSGDVPQWRDKTLALLPPELVANEIEQIASEITVKIQGKHFLGSGIIVHQQDNKYLVLTNQHVLRAGEPPFKIQTANGTIYQAEVVTSPSSSNDDLALLSFVSSDRLNTAAIGNSAVLQEGEMVFAAGFPANLLDTHDKSLSVIDGVTKNSTSFPTKSGFNFTEGRVAVILDKPLQQGYQIGYTNHVLKGMSGGPLLDRRGRVVGVNGRHAYPLWEAPDFYEDNSQLCPPLQELITRSSLAIPIEKALTLSSQANFTIDTSGNNSGERLQDRRLLSTIITENNSQTAIEADISSKHCQ